MKNIKLKLIPKTDYQLLVELRNQVASRIISQKASKRYWQIMSKETKKDTQERIDTLQKVSLNEQLISADKKYLQVIDEMLEVQNGNS